MKKISEEEYNEWIKTAEWVGNERCVFSSCCGPHDFSMDIRKDGMLYELNWGWYPKEDTSPDAKCKYKDIKWWGIRVLHKDVGQEGEGV